MYVYAALANSTNRLVFVYRVQNCTIIYYNTLMHWVVKKLKQNTTHRLNRKRTV
jgi:hypothetical protein